MKVTLSILLFIIYTIIVLVIYYAHITFFKVDVVLYSSLLDGVIATVITSCIVFGSTWFKSFSKFEKLQLVTICLLTGALLALSVPTIIDRSLSFYILEKIHQRGGGVRLDRFEDIFKNEYLKEHRLVDVRLTEQEQSGTIIIQNGCVQLTERGRALAQFSRFFRKNLLPRQRLLAGEYTDVLTDPFRYSESNYDYRCE